MSEPADRWVRTRLLPSSKNVLVAASARAGRAESPSNAGPGNVNAALSTIGNEYGVLRNTGNGFRFVGVRVAVGWEIDDPFGVGFF